ncbi:MAG: ATP-binding protein [Allorhizobium sp.]
MPAIQYPFIDIAVHPSVRDRFSRGEALVLFAPNMERVLWANGAGADFFGNPSIYDFLEQGPDRQNIAFRQLEGTARQLRLKGDSRTLMVRIASGFMRMPAQATVEMVQVKAGEDAVLFSVPTSGKLPDLKIRAAAMLSGFDDPDTHMALLDGDGNVIAASAQFAGLGLTPHTAKTLVTLVGAGPDRLLKRPIPTGRGYLPAAIGKLSDDPALHLLFTIETILGTMDPSLDFDEDRPVTAATPSPVPALPAEVAAVSLPLEEPAVLPLVETIPAETFEAVVTAIGGIEDIDEIEPNSDDDAYSEATDASDEIDAAGKDPAEMAVTGTEVDPQDDTAPAGGALPADSAIVDDFDAAEAAIDDDLIEVASPDEPVQEEPAAVGDDDASRHEIKEDEIAAEGMVETGVPLAPVIDDTIPVNVADDRLAETAADAAPEEETHVLPAAPAMVATAPAKSGETPFVFAPGGRATRFVWKIDAEGQFSDVSPEFALAVGPRAADINGLAFGDLAALFHLDPDGRIAELLKKRDTWSGKTIFWPVEGTALMVPVDLAALPTYSRNRDFDGFRGFGIVRMADAVADPNAFGLTFTQIAPVQETIELNPEPETTESQTTEAETTEAETPVAAEEPSEAFAADDQFVTEALVTEPVEQPEMAGADAQGTETGLFHNPQSVQPGLPADERPPLKIAETPSRRFSDKVIQLEDRRTRNRDGLSVAEQAAFREIARKLDPLGLHSSSDESDDTAADPSQLDPMPEPESPGEREAAAVIEAFTNHPDDLPQTPVEQEVEANDNVDADAVSAVQADGSSAPEESAAVATVAPMFSVRAKTESGLTPEIVDLMPVALLIHVGDRLIHGNPEFWRLTGYETLEALDEAGGLDALLQRSDIEATSENAGRVMVLRADDELIPVTARLQSVRFEQSSALMLALMPVRSEEAEPQPTEAGATHEAIGQAMDAGHATADQQARLQVEVEELRSILETATDGVVILGANGDIRSMNRSASALFNYDEQETRGKPFVMLYAHESQKAILDYLAGLSGHGVASVLNDGREVIGREASGGFFPLFMTIGRLTSSDGYCAVIRDITQWKRTEEELRNAKRAAETANAHKSDFLARVSHEIRTPLNAIIGFADMMAGERFGPIGHTRYAEYANDIGRSGRHVLDIVNDLLDISKIEAGEMDLDFVSVGLNETVASAVSIVQPQANSQRVIIRTALSQAVPDVVADPRSIRQIALNILANAIRFTPSGGQIIVSTAYEPNGSVILRIRDTGIGMSRTELEQAMKPFRQIAGAAQHRGDGTGLGLPLTKAMVDANRANFAIHSTPNEGTLVEITFPSPRVLAN